MTPATPLETSTRKLLVRLVSLLVGANGLFILATTLLEQIAVHRGSRVSTADVDIPLLLGVGFIYLSSLLARRKQNAWRVSIAVLVFMIGLNTERILEHSQLHHGVRSLALIRLLLVPLFVLVVLWLERHEFQVRSDVQIFRTSLRFSCIILLATFLYGTAGFLLLDRSDFHQEITLAGAMQRTVDQFDLTTNHPLQPHTKRAHLFTDSLSFISVVTVGAAVISFFQPVSARFSAHASERQRFRALLIRSQARSEDYFKLWPPDKRYFFSSNGQAALAYKVKRGVAVCLGDPVGNPADFSTILAQFQQICAINDWVPSFIHLEATHRKLYENQDYTLQKIGEEALVSITQFQTTTVRNKYFRNVKNRFEKAGFTTEVLAPPHGSATITALRSVSDAWLTLPGRSERGFFMGYFSEAYLQQCPVLILRDSEGVIVGFMNFVPADFDHSEATYDMLRHLPNGPNNVSDYMMLAAIAYAQTQGYERFNAGLCPLVGLTKEEADSNLIDSALRFVYLNGDRFYSFQGLHRFKAKYEPEWRDRFLAYPGGIRNFGRVVNALLLLTKVKV